MLCIYEQSYPYFKNFNKMGFGNKKYNCNYFIDKSFNIEDNIYLSQWRQMLLLPLLLLT